MALVIEGRPVTKKNSQRFVPAMRGRRPVLLQSRQYLAWEQAAVLQLRSQAFRRGGLKAPLTWPQNMRAVVYRDRDVGDLLNYLAAVSDALEAAGIVKDDKLIVSVDGSRMYLDRVRPRVEVELSPA